MFKKTLDTTILKLITIESYDSKNLIEAIDFLLKLKRKAFRCKPQKNLAVVKHTRFIY